MVNSVDSQCPRHSDCMLPLWRRHGVALVTALFRHGGSSRILSRLGVPLVCSSWLHGGSMATPWCPPWSCHGISMVRSLRLHGDAMVSLRRLHGFTMTIAEKPTWPNKRCAQYKATNEERRCGGTFGTPESHLRVGPMRP